ncbi:MFS transporter [Candidatus Pacearchaeota archaeon]|nr:MFS transporter [Candidatus Pacearchaeota archaeon]MBD3283631.1 MFS transporter [Candidatus Pacearchaeota archaeon]
MIEKTNKSRIYMNSLFFVLVCYLVFSVNENFIIFLVFAAILVFSRTLKLTSFGIIVREKSPEKKLSRNEGVMFTSYNIALVLGPLIAGTVLKIYGISYVFFLCSVSVFIALTYFYNSKINVANIKRKTDRDLLRNFKDFFKSKDRLFAYVIGGGVNFWWSLIYLFMPIYIVRNGLGVEWVGYFLFAAAFPLILFSYKFSQIAGKIGFRKVFQLGFLIPAVFALFCFYSSNIYIIFLFLIFASIGLAMLEPTTEAYFFDILKGKEDLRFYGPYNTTIDFNRFLGGILSAFLLLFMPFKFIFLLFSIVMFLLFLLSFKTRNIIESRRDGKKN